MVVRIRDIHIVLCVNGKGMGPVEAGACGRAVVAGISPLIRIATAGKGGDDARGIDLANAVVVRIRDIHIASLIDSETGGASEVGVGCAAPIPAKLPDARACKRGQRAIAYLPHHMGLGFADDQRVALEDQGGRRGEFPICGCREGLDDARFDLANAIVARVRDVNIAAGIRCDALRILEERVGCRAAIAGKSAGFIPRTRDSADGQGVFCKGLDEFDFDAAGREPLAFRDDDYAARVLACAITRGRDAIAHRYLIFAHLL